MAAKRKAETKAKRGRPTRYTKALAQEICRRLAEGESLRSICRSPHMPPAPTVCGWVAEDLEGFAEQYARSRDIGLDMVADHVIAIADGEDSEGDTARDRLRFDARRWYLSKMAPKRYGDKLEEAPGADDPVPVSVNVEVKSGRADTE